MIYQAQDSEPEAVMTVARLMAASARTAPKGRGADRLVTMILTGADKSLVAEQMEKISLAEDIPFFKRDAANVREAAAVVLLGTSLGPLGVPYCGYCGYPDCRACSQACRYSAILALKDRVLTFPKLCHGCGGCMLACPASAISEVERPTGVVEWGVSPKGPQFVHGRLQIGEAMSPPLIRQVRARVAEEPFVVFDAPPGTSCPVIEAVKKSDVVLLVSEPTPFGLNDLKLAEAMVRKLGLPHGVIVNRAGIGDQALQEWCRQEGVPILMEISDDRRIAEGYSRGRLAIESLPELAGRFLELLEKLPGLPAPAPVVETAEPAVAGGEQDPYPSDGLPPGSGRQVTEIAAIAVPK